MAKFIWTEEKVEHLRNNYMTRYNSVLSEELGCNEKAIISKARELGLHKGSKIKNLPLRDVVRKHFYDKSFKEIAEVAGISESTVIRIVKELGLCRTPEQNRSIRSRIRKEIINKEYRRVLFGLEPITKVKVVTNKKRLYLRQKLKECGYTVIRGTNTIYYSENLPRRIQREKNGRNMGLKFSPISELRRENSETY